MQAAWLAASNARSLGTFSGVVSFTCNCQQVTTLEASYWIAHMRAPNRQQDDRGGGAQFINFLTGECTMYQFIHRFRWQILKSVFEMLFKNERRTMTTNDFTTVPFARAAIKRVRRSAMLSSHPFSSLR
jgi:hypothetical protein